ncbi:hypothetical protein E3P96_01240 [Wallemia ichthyophaga]|nr:hypothetical protein E3P96_01240 [Wallemia ichthyophaga]
MTEFSSKWSELSNQLKELDGVFGSHANSPTTSYLNESEMDIFGSFPLSSINDDDDALKVVNCTECARPVQKSALQVHLINCAQMKQISQQNTAINTTTKRSKIKKEDTPTRTPTPSAESTHSTNNRKRRLSDVSQQSTTWSASPQKKSRKLDVDKPKNKAANNKDKEKDKEKEKGKKDKDEGPIDLDSQCGVINAKGTPCSRSLTCKTHPMGAKRAVEGRTKPYDVLTYEFELKRKPELAEKPLPKAVTQFEADRAANGRKKTGQSEHTAQTTTSAHAPITPTITPRLQPPHPPPMPPKPTIVEKPVGVTSWDDFSKHDEPSLPASGIELELEVTKIRAATTSHRARPLAAPANRMAGLQKRHKNDDGEELRPHKRKREGILERSLSNLQLENVGENENKDIEMTKSGSYEADKNRIVVYDIDEYQSDNEGVGDNNHADNQPKYKLPKLLSNTHDIMYKSMWQQRKQGEGEKQLVLYKPLHISTQGTQETQGTATDTDAVAMEQ